MKKTIIGAIVGGLLIFICQTLSWTVLDLHRSAQDYTPKQDTIMHFLSSVIDKEGGYLLPGMPKGTSFDDANKAGLKGMGKPWAFIEYHSSYTLSMNDMYMNMVRGLLSTMFMVWLVCWIISKFSKPSFGNIFLACLFIGLVVYINVPYNSFIWYKIFDSRAYLHDSILGWGVCGLWLGWWMRKK